MKSPISGHLVQYLVSEGQSVAPGTIIATVEPDQSQELMLAQASADSRLKSLAKTQSEAELRRVRELHAAGIVSTVDVEAAVNRCEAAAEAYRLSTKQVQILRGRLHDRPANHELFSVVAPIGGMVLTPLVARGDAIMGATNGLSTTGGTPVIRLADMSAVSVRSDVSEVDVDKLRTGMKATVTPVGGTTSYLGHVTRIAAEATLQQNTTIFTVDTSIDQGRSFRPGMSADVEILLTEHERALCLPLSAVDFDSKQPFVTMGSGVRRKIHTGIDDGEYVEIREGLRDGDIVRATPNPALSRP